MTKHNKILALVLAMLVASFAFAACDDDSDGQSGSQTVDLATVALDKVGVEAGKIFDAVDSVHISQTVDMEVTMMGSPAKINVNAESDVSVAQQAAHTVAKANSNGLTMDAEMYVTKNGEDASVYANINNSTWMKQNIKVAELKTLDSYNDAYESAKFFIAALQGVERTSTTHMGSSAILVKGVLDSEDPEGILSNAGLGSTLGQSGINTATFQQMLTGLEAVEVSIYLDAATGLPLEIQLDMTAFMTSVYANLGKVFGQSIDVSVGHAIASMKFTNYNAVSVAVPAEVEAAITGN